MAWIVDAAVDGGRQSGAETRADAGRDGDGHRLRARRIRHDLLKGRSDPQATARIVKRVTELTGLDEGFVRRAGGRIEIGAFLREVAREGGKIGSVYDSNVTVVRSVPVRARSAQQRSAAREHHRADHDGDGRLRHPRGRLEGRRPLQRAQLRGGRRLGQQQPGAARGRRAGPAANRSPPIPSCACSSCTAGTISRARSWDRS